MPCVLSQPRNNALQSWEPFAIRYRYARHNPGIVAPTTVRAEAPLAPSPTSPYDFDAPDANPIFAVVGWERVPGPVHRLFHNPASPGFRGGAFSLSKPAEPPLRFPLSISPSPPTFPAILRYLYPRWPRADNPRCKKPGGQQDGFEI